MTDPKPLIPVNLKGLEALANELLSPVKTDKETQNSVTPPTLKNPASYIFLPERTHGSYSYPNTWVSKKRLGFNKDVEEIAKKLNLTVQNTAKEKDGHDYIGSINHKQSLDINEALGNITLTQRQYIDLFLLLKSGNVLDGNTARVSKSDIESILDEMLGKRDPGRSEWTSNKFKDVRGTLNIIYPVFKGGKWQEVTEPLEHYVKESCYVDLASFNRQGMPTRKSTIQKYKFGENIYYYPPVDCAVAWFYAVSDGAWLSCGRGPSNSYTGLGVRPSRTSVQRRAAKN